LVLSDQTGFKRDYNRDPYEGYDTSPHLIFNVDKLSNQFHPKEKIVGIELEGLTKAYPFSELATLEQPVQDTLNKIPILVFYDNKSQTATIQDAAGEELPSVVGFWFAWYAFHPET